MSTKIQKRANEPAIHASFERPRVTALLGARRVGKTTLLKSYMSQHPDRKWVFFNMDRRDQRLRVENSELEHSVALEKSQIKDIGTRIQDSLIGRDVVISRSPFKPKALKLTLADHSQVGIL